MMMCLSSCQLPTHTFPTQQVPMKDGHAAAKAILALEGVVDHGLFMDMVDVCIIAGSNGVEVKERKK
jgi:ribose 5-phosphate isomerase